MVTTEATVRSTVDMKFLIYLQKLREAFPAPVTQLFMLISDFVVSPALIALPCVVYWCLDKRKGAHILFSFGFGAVLNNLIKICVCVPRPWLRDTRITPHESALETATGYSFPSGHTQSAASVFGSLGWSYRERFGWAVPVAAVLTAVVAFSRCLLGVHAPQDVIVGMALGVFCVWLAGQLVTWADAGEGRDAAVTIVACVLTAAACVFVAVKPYPAVAGLSAEHQALMALDTYKALGMFPAAFLGWWAERRYVRFEARCDLRRGMARIVLGIAVVVAFRYVLAWPVSLIGNEAAFEFVKNFLTTVAAVVVAPLAFTNLEARIAEASRTGE